MPVFNTKKEEIGQSKNQILILQPTTIDELTSHHSRRSPVVKYVISMLRIENNNSIRTRRINRSPWSESFNNKLSENHSIFRIGDTNQKVEIPITVPMENTSGTITTTNKNLLRCIYENIEQYFSNSTLHGLRYVGDPSISFGERLFWLCSFFSAICFATYFITSLYVKYNESPVIMSLNPKLTSLYSIPFPAITICNMNQAKKSEAERILSEGTDVEKMLLDDYCNLNTTTVDRNSVTDEATKWDNVQKFIIKVNPSCNEMLKVCFWKQEELDCSYLFNSALTDEGLCCTFNALPRNLIFRNPREMSDLNLTFPPEVDDWNPERGYSENATPTTLPFKAPGAGTHLGLSVVLDTAIHSYYCSSTSSVGFKVLLHNPVETPKMADYAFLLPPGVESRISIVPKIFDATLPVRDIDIQKRMCFFTNERHLQFYRTYTERNCKLECQANYTLQQCSCVPFYLPKNKNKKICSKKQEVCSNVAKITMETSNSNGSSCNCLPGCFELGFDSRATYGHLTDALRLKDNILKNESVSYFVNNMVIMHFHFVDSQFVRSTKSVLYGFSEFLSNTGGLLGLFLGFSFLSAVEVAYYLSLRVLCKLMRSRKKNRTPNKKGHPVNNPALYPFSK